MNEEIKLQIGDIFLTNNYSIGAKIVMFLMQSPTVWQQIWRWYKGTLEPVAFYHAGMVLNENEMIEQQGKVQIANVDKIFKKDYVIWRNKDLTEENKIDLEGVAFDDLGEGYGVLECFGKLFTWLTGIKWFSKWFDMKDRAICVVRVAEWYSCIDLENFGVDDPNYITTKVLYEYCNKSKDWYKVAERK